LKAKQGVLQGFGDGWRLRILFKSDKNDYHLSIMETTEEIWNNLEDLLDLVGKAVKVEVTGYKVTKIEGAG